MALSIIAAGLLGVAPRARDEIGGRTRNGVGEGVTTGVRQELKGMLF